MVTKQSIKTTARTLAMNEGIRTARSGPFPTFSHAVQNQRIHDRGAMKAACQDECLRERAAGNVCCDRFVQPQAAVREVIHAQRARQ